MLLQPAQGQQPVLPDMFPAHVARMYTNSTAAMWDRVLEVLKKNRFEFSVKDENGRFLVTRPTNVETRRFGFDTASVQPRLSSGRVQLHVYVPPYIEPGRVYVNSVLDAASAEVVSGATRDVRRRFYNLEPFGRWLFDQLDRDLDTPGHEVPIDARKRLELARSLTAGGHGDPCLAAGAADPVRTPGRTERPTKLHEEQALSPRDLQSLQQSRQTLVDTLLTEDGFAWPIRLLNSDTADPAFVGATVGAVSLWRYSPARMNDCPRAINYRVSMTFSLR